MASAQLSAVLPEVVTVSPQLTSREYAAAVFAFSGLPTGAGQNHKGLAEFLDERPGVIDITDPNQLQRANLAHENQNPFLTLYRLSAAKKVLVIPPDPPSEGIDFATCDEFEAFTLKLDEEARSEILFLRGYPSPQWLNTIGSKYKLDPEYFARHLDFLTPATSRNFSTPPLPSSSRHLIQLSVTTIGSRDRQRHNVQQSEIDSLRELDKREMDAYLQSLSKGSGFTLGDAMVRQYSTVDETYFAIEQRVSIFLLERERSWSVFVWLDAGNDLMTSLKGPWSKDEGETQLHPIINYRPMDGLRAAELADRVYPHHGISRRNNPRPQIAALLHKSYGKTLKPELAGCDAFYALNEVLSLMACSESQLLNLVDEKLSSQLDRQDTQEFGSLSNLKFFRDLLYRHINQLQESILAIGNARSSSTWPKTVEAEANTNSVLRDFEHNLEHARRLDTRCCQDISILMSAASIAESKKAMAQQERVGKLTFLVFLFVPLSFTTGLFGMNLKELNGTGSNLSIWMWFVVSGPFVALTLAAYFVNTKTLVRICKRLGGMNEDNNFGGTH